MKHMLTPARSAVLVFGTAFLSFPALAQDNVVGPVPAPAQQEAAPQSAPATEAPNVIMAPPSPVVQPLPAEPEQAPAAGSAEPAPRSETPAPRARISSRAPAPRPAERHEAVAPVAAATPAPEQTPVPAPALETAAINQPAPDQTPPGQSPGPEVTPPPVEQLQATGEQATQTLWSRAFGYWPWLVAALLVLGGVIAYFDMRRRRALAEEYDYAVEEEVPATDVPTAEVPAREFVPTGVAGAHSELLTRKSAADPVANTHAAKAEAGAEDLAGIVNGKPPVEHRPWLEFGLRPLRAGTSGDEARVEIELTVGNAGDTAARDVRIAAFMLRSGKNGEMERMLIDPPADAMVSSASIEPGGGTRVDATLALPTEALPDPQSYRPVVVADARYRLPDGGEGRTTAAFELGLTDPDGEGFRPIALDRAGMSESVTAHLHGIPAHV